MVKAVIFDMDDLMIKSEALHFQAYKKVAEEFGIDFTREDYWRLWGLDKEMCERFVKEFKLKTSWEEVLLKKNAVYRSTLHTIQPKKGLFELLKKLKAGQYLIAVASGSQLYEVDAVLNNLGIKHYFDEIISAETVENGKPSPEGFLLAAKRLHVLPEACLVLEDSPRGIQAARAAGMKCFAIPSEGVKESQVSDATKILSSLKEVYTLLKEI